MRRRPSASPAPQWLRRPGWPQWTPGPPRRGGGRARPAEKAPATRTRGPQEPRRRSGRPERRCVLSGPAQRQETATLRGLPLGSACERARGRGDPDDPSVGARRCGVRAPRSQGRAAAGCAQGPGRAGGGTGGGASAGAERAETSLFGFGRTGSPRVRSVHEVSPLARSSCRPSPRPRRGLEFMSAPPPASGPRARWQRAGLALPSPPRPARPVGVGGRPPRRSGRASGTETGVMSRGGRTNTTETPLTYDRTKVFSRPRTMCR